jgi:peptidoglycan/LPS O-acetylase OafA/YrhL
MQDRQTHLDMLRLVAAQLIVLHHLSAYGPVAEAAHAAAPGLMAWLFDYARMAVQVFLVVGGYLAVQNLTRATQAPAAGLLNTLLRRYQRLVLPFLVALALSVASAVLARHWLHDTFIPAAPTWEQVLAHTLLLHGVLGVEALSAGVWYVAIDFQLFALLALLLWLGRRQARLAQAAVISLMLASLFVFNRHAVLDNWALYFFAAYGMGALAGWAKGSIHPARWLLLLSLAGALALALEFRLRIALALGVALLLGLMGWWQRAQSAPAQAPSWLAAPIKTLGRSSYALFLVHFPVLMLGNALFARLGLSGPISASAMLLVCWMASVVLALWFERWVEAPLARFRFSPPG